MTVDAGAQVTVVPRGYGPDGSLPASPFVASADGADGSGLAGPFHAAPPFTPATRRNGEDPRATNAQPRLLIRLDADASVGFGHLTRCLALATEWPGKCAVAFRSASDEARTLMERAGVGAVALSGEDARRRCAEVAELARKHGAAAVVLDSYEVDAQGEGLVLGAGLPVLRVDDLADRNPYRSHLLLNVNLGAEKLLYATAGRTRKLLGPEYFPLRPDLRGIEPQPAPETVERVLVLPGGADRSGFCARALRALDALPCGPLRVRVVTGSPPGEDVAAAVTRSRHEVEVDLAPPSLAPYLRNSDVAISGAGTTKYELAAAGVPSVFCALADNQAGLAEEFQTRGAALASGLTAGSLEGAITQLLGMSAEERDTMAKAARGLVDGEGARRVIEALLGLLA